MNEQIIKRFTPEEWIYECKVFLQERYDAEKVKYYIDEAEHQDGGSYWAQFPDLHALRTDFELFLIHCD